jgi:DNA-binding PadR family transcriptional regulator
MSTKYALLGLLNIRKMSAYDLAKFAKDYIDFFWNESYSNVHRTLRILADEKLIHKSPEIGSRNKAVYEITPLGQEALSEWLSNHQYTTIYRDELLLKLFVSHRDDYPALLEDLKNALNDLLAQGLVYSEIKESVLTNVNNLSFDLALDYGIMQNEVTIEWLKKSIKIIEEAL